MPTLEATAGATDANSYLTVAEADVFADERLQSSAWTGETDTDVKERALIQATRRIDLLTFEGEKADSDQALKWPRLDVIDDNGDEYDSDAVPDLVKRAAFEGALWLLNQNADSTDPMAPTGLGGFNRAKVGPLEVEPRHGRRGGELPDHVVRMLRPVRRSMGLTTELVRS